MNLDEKQNAAANAGEGQYLVIACPGSGKTTVIIERVHRLIEQGIPPIRMLVITFTKAAADEMADRYEKKFGPCNIMFGTIHSVCFKVLQKAYGYHRENILTQAEQWDFFRQYLFKRVTKTDLEEYIRQLLTEISYVRNKRMDPRKFESSVCDTNMFVELLERYNDFKRESAKLDFDDMLILCRHCLIHNPEELTYWKKQFQYIMIDEFQDTNQIQADIFYMLAGKNGNLFVVGDDDQSIYGFRSADSSIMLDFKKWYPDCQEIYLDTNYRSAEKIVRSASMLIDNNNVRFRKKIKPFRQDKGLIYLSCMEDAITQVKSVIANLEMFHKDGIEYEEMAVLYRTNVQNQLLVSMLLMLNNAIPFYTTEQPKDIHNEFIYVDLMAYWRLASGNWKNGDLQRILNRPSRFLKSEVFKNCPFHIPEILARCRRLPKGQDAKAIDQIYELTFHLKNLKDLPPEAFITYVMKTMRYEVWLNSYAEFTGKDIETLFGTVSVLKEEAKQFGTMQDWNGYADFFSKKLLEMKRLKSRQGVCLSTFHSAKGLEWKAVTIIDCNEGVCPYRKAEKPEEFEEERRLFYVACTRAKDRLMLLYLKGQYEKNLYPSRYLHELGLMGYTPII